MIAVRPTTPRDKMSHDKASRSPSDPGPLAAWDVQEYQFPEHGSTEERLAFALRYAMLAPSTHNTQPWRFRIAGRTVELFADHARQLPAIDPSGRELVMSCGAALFHLRLALRHFRYAAPVELLPDPRRPDLLARVELGDWCQPTRGEEELFHAITVRRTHRGPFEPIVVPAELVADMQREAARGGARLVVVAAPRLKQHLADLIARADRTQFTHRTFRREVAAWVRDNHSDAHDGIPGYALGLGEAGAVAEPLIVRGFDVGRLQGSWDHQLAATAPVLVVLGTEGDTAEDWIKAGQALARVLLRACANGVYASFLTQPIEVAGLRPWVQELVGMREVPQLMLRMGYGSQGRPTPRRGIADVIDRT